MTTKLLLTLAAVCAASAAFAASASGQTTGPYEIHPVSSTFCLDVRGGETATANGTLVQQWGCWGGTNQEWTLTPAFISGSYEIHPVSAPGSCLDVRGGGTAEANGTPVQIWGCWGGGNQEWYLNPSANSPSAWTLIRPESAITVNACLDIAGGGMNNGTPAQIWTCWAPSQQQFYLTLTATGAAMGAHK